MEPTDLLNPPEGNNVEPNTQEFKIPEEYANNAAFQGINNMDDLCKKIVNQESLIGKKYIGIPDDKSTPEEIAKYREAIGVPIKFEDYQLDASPEIKQVYGEDDQKVLGEFKQLMFNAGLSQKQAGQMREGYDKIMAGVIEQQKAKQLEINNEFEQLVTQSFGNQKDEKMKIAQAFIQANVSENLKPYLPHVLQDNQSLLVLADIANNVYPNLRADDITTLKPSGSTGATPESVRAKMQEIIASDAFQNSRHPGNEQAKKDLQEQAKLLESITK